MYEIKIEGLEKVINLADGIGPEFNEAVRRALFRSAHAVRTRSLQSGLVPYRTGTLRRSITVEVDQNEARIGSNLPYAAIHEFGGTFTRTSAWGRPTRPYSVTYRALHYLGRPFEQSLPEIEGIFEEEMQRAVSSGR